MREIVVIGAGKIGSTVAGMLATLAIVVITPRLFTRVPGTILAMVGLTIAASAMHLPVETIGSRFGGVPSGLPHVIVPTFHVSLVLKLLSPAMTVALLGAIESLLSATVADRMSGTRHNPNVELIAQGVANIASPLFGGLPATGAIARTATNIRSGARTPLAGMVHALTLLAILLFAAPLARFVPLAVLSAILFVVAYHMGDWEELPELFKLTRADISVWLVTFALTVFADLSVAVQAGMILAALLFIRKVAATTTITRITPEDIERDRAHVLQDKVIPPYAAMYRIHGPFLFGTTDKLDVIADHIESLPTIVILRLRNMTAMDASGLRAIEDLADRLHASGRALIVCGARAQPARLMARADFHERVGDANICESAQNALDRAREIHQEAR
jgi:SulP family sulfate permease